MKPKIVISGDIALDLEKMEIRRAGKVVTVTYLEFKLVDFLMRRPEVVFSRAQLLAAVWPRRKRATVRTVDNYIMRLRKKFAEPGLFRTVQRVGYKYVPPVGSVHASDKLRFSGTEQPCSVN